MVFSLRAYFGNPSPDQGEKHDMWLEASTLGGGNGGVRGGKRDMTYCGLFGNGCPVYRLCCVVCGDCPHCFGGALVWKRAESLYGSEALMEASLVLR